MHRRWLGQQIPGVHFVKRKTYQTGVILQCLGHPRSAGSVWKEGVRYGLWVDFDHMMVYLLLGPSSE